MSEKNQIYIYQRKLLTYFRENYQYILDKVTHLSQRRKKQKIKNQRNLTENNFNFQHLGGFLPILKGRKTSKIKPEFVIFDPLRGESQSSSLLPLSSIDAFAIFVTFVIFVIIVIFVIFDPLRGESQLSSLLPVSSFLPLSSSI